MDGFVGWFQNDITILQVRTPGVIEARSAHLRQTTTRATTHHGASLPHHDPSTTHAQARGQRRPEDTFRPPITTTTNTGPQQGTQRAGREAANQLHPTDNTHTHTHNLRAVQRGTAVQATIACMRDRRRACSCSHRCYTEHMPPITNACSPRPRPL